MYIEDVKLIILERMSDIRNKHADIIKQLEFWTDGTAEFDNMKDSLLFILNDKLIELEYILNKIDKGG